MKTLKQIVLPAFMLSTFWVNAQNKAFEVSLEEKGQPILLFPGFSCTGAVWENTVVELLKSLK